MIWGNGEISAISFLRFSGETGKRGNGETGNIIFPIAPLVGKRGNRESIYTVGIYSRFTDSPQVRKVP